MSSNTPRLTGLSAARRLPSFLAMPYFSLSIVVPLFDEEDNLRPLVQAVRQAMAGHVSWELVLVDDGSGDATAEVAERIAREDRRVRLIRLARQYGQTAALKAGFDAARGGIIVTMDGDLQNDPEDIPRLLAKLNEGYDLVSGYRDGRQDGLIARRLPSLVANRIISWLTGVKIRDSGCPLKAYRREVVDRLDLYSDAHRFIPALAAATAGARIAEIPVRHHRRRHGRSKYGLSRVPQVLADLLTLKMIRSFRERPLVMFAAGAAVAAFFGLASGAAAAVAALTFGPEKASAMVFPSVAVLWFGLSFYLLMLGLIAEVALREARRTDLLEPPILSERLR